MSVILVHFWISEFIFLDFGKVQVVCIDIKLLVKDNFEMVESGFSKSILNLNFTLNISDLFTKVNDGLHEPESPTSVSKKWINALFAYNSAPCFNSCTIKSKTVLHSHWVALLNVRLTVLFLQVLFESKS